MPALIHGIAWKGETPWHGLGEKVSADATGAQMLEIAGLNWTVRRRVIAMRNLAGVVTKEPLAKFRAIVRDDNDQVFQVATEDYHPLQNKEIVEFFREYCEAGHASMETVGALKGGAVVWALAKLNGGSDVTLAGNDALKGYMLLATSHDGSLRTIGKPTQVRVVCWNTLSMALGLRAGRLGEKEVREFRMRHTRKWSPAVAAEAKQIMGMSIELMQANNQLAEKLSKVKIDDEGRLQFLEQLLKVDGSIVDAVVETQQPTGNLLDNILDAHAQNAPQSREDRLGRVGKKVLDAMLNSPGAGLPSAKDTLWGAVNGVTWFADHVRGNAQDTRLANAWFGAGDKLKQSAVTVARQMAGIN